MLTKEIRAVQSRPRESAGLALAVTILFERISTLPKADRDDLFELLIAWGKAEDLKERDEILDGMMEILAQIPAEARALPAAPERVAAGKLEKLATHIGKAIRDLRDAAGWTQQQLAAAAGIDQGYLSRLENGEHCPTFKTVSKIAGALEVEPGKIDPCLNV